MTRARLVRAVAATLLAVAVVAGAAFALQVLGRTPIRSSARRMSTPSHPTVPSQPTTRRRTATLSQPATPPPAPSTRPVVASGSRIDRRMRTLSSRLPAGGVSVAALNTTTGAHYSWGATGGMRLGSVAKVYLLEALLLRHQDAGTRVTDDEDGAATRMIENSDNAAADALYDAIGDRASLAAAGRRLGLKHTIQGPVGYWGFTQTSASDMLVLMSNLVRARPLTRYSRDYALRLMRHVESDQRWGVGVVADPETRFANKNGWLSVRNGNPGGNADDGRWLVNSVGVLTVHGQQVLMAVLTQHGPDFEDGVELVESLATAITPAVVAA